MTLTALFTSAFVVGLSGAMMPGPVLTATVTHALRRGRWAGPMIVAGHAIPELAVMGLVIAGGAGFLSRPLVLGVLGVAGGLVMLWMGADILRSLRQAVLRTEATLAAEEQQGAASWRGPVLAGIVLSVTNPYWTLWWAVIGLNFAARALERGWVGLGAFYTGHILSDLAWYSVVSFAIAGGRRHFPPILFKVILAACGVALLALGLKFGIDGVKRF